LGSASPPQDTGKTFPRKQKNAGKGGTGRVKARNCLPISRLSRAEKRRKARCPLGHARNPAKIKYDKGGGSSILKKSKGWETRASRNRKELSPAPKLEEEEGGVLRFRHAI